jgi:hypothetical protein
MRGVPEKARIYYKRAMSRKSAAMPNKAERPRGVKRTHAMMSGVSWSSMKVMRSRNTSRRFFRR